MSTIDIQEQFSKADNAAFINRHETNNTNIAVAIFHGLKLIALAIIYHANNR